MPSNSAKTDAAPVISLPCMCANLRRAARVVTQLYDEVLRPTGLRVAQFTLLQALHMAPGISQKRLAGLLGVDSTTLTRTLSSLRRKGWLKAEAGSDRRELRLGITKTGLEEYKRVLPYWNAAQRRLKKELGDGNWDKISDAAIRVTAVATSREE